MKAFLSHSSFDKEFVRAVALELGRQYCVFDEQAFLSGEEFKNSIITHLDDTHIFVLFASRKALSSMWVKFEIEEAWYRKIQGKIKKSSVYLLDSSIEYKDIPEWLQRALIKREVSPKAIARDIRLHLDNLLRERQRPLFIGRNQQIEELESKLLPIDGSLSPRTVFITGLPGIGRRSLTFHTTPRLLNFKKHVEIRVKSGDTMNDVCTRVADRIEPYSTQQGLKRIIDEIQKLSFDEARERTLRDFRIMTHNGELPILFDEGGLLDYEGYIQPPFRALLKALESSGDIYLFLISTRKPQLELGDSFPIISIPQLSADDTKRLISAFANSVELEISQSEINELVDYVAGYPPAIYFAVRQAKDYGLSLVMRDKTQLRQFLTSIFLRHLAEAQLCDEEVELIRILAAYSPLPFAVLADLLDIEPPALDKSIMRLIDLALINTTDDGYYRISDPITDAVVRAFGYPAREYHEALAEVMDKFLKNLKSSNSRIELSSVLFRAARFSNNKKIGKSVVHLASDLIELTEVLYHNRRYSEAIEAGFRAINERPDNPNVRSYLIRSLIQEENWAEAENQIKQLQRYAPLRDAKFLLGFLERKRGRIRNAIDYYTEAVRLGRKDAGVYRELAQCYFLRDDLTQAAHYITEAIARHPDNPFVIDLWIQILTRQRDEKSAREALTRLQRIDEPLFYYHRLSRVELAFGHKWKAREAAKQAMSGTEKPPFEVMAQLIYCDVELGELDEADELLRELSNKYGNIRRDVQIGLRCRIEIARGHFSEALDQTERISDKGTITYKAIRRDALAGELDASVLTDELRSSYQLELKSLQSELSLLSADRLIPMEFELYYRSI